jgi:hypothetical protein
MTYKLLKKLGDLVFDAFLTKSTVRLRSGVGGAYFKPFSTTLSTDSVVGCGASPARRELEIEAQSQAALDGTRRHAVEKRP